MVAVYWIPLATGFGRIFFTSIRISSPAPMDLRLPLNTYVPLHAPGVQVSLISLRLCQAPATEASKVISVGLTGLVRVDIPSNLNSNRPRGPNADCGPIATVFLSSPPSSWPSLILNNPFFAPISSPFPENLTLFGETMPVVRVVRVESVEFALFQKSICSLIGSAIARRFPEPDILLIPPNSVSRGDQLFPQRTPLPMIRVEPEYTLKPSLAILYTPAVRVSPSEIPSAENVTKYC